MSFLHRPIPRESAPKVVNILTTYLTYSGINGTNQRDFHTVPLLDKQELFDPTHDTHFQRYYFDNWAITGILLNNRDQQYPQKKISEYY